MTKAGRKRKSKRNRKASIPTAAFRTLEENQRIAEQTRRTREEKRAQRARKREERRERRKLPRDFDPEAPLETYTAEQMQTYLDEMSFEPLHHLIDYLPADFLASIPPGAETISIQIHQSTFDDLHYVHEDPFRPYADAGKISLDSGIYTITLPLPLHEYQPMPQYIFRDVIEKSPDFDALALAGGATIDIQVTREAVARAGQDSFERRHYLHDHHWGIVQHHAYTCTISQATLRLHAIRKALPHEEFFWHIYTHTDRRCIGEFDAYTPELQELAAKL